MWCIVVVVVERVVLVTERVNGEVGVVVVVVEKAGYEGDKEILEEARWGKTTALEDE